MKELKTPPQKTKKNNKKNKTTTATATKSFERGKGNV